MSEPVSYILDRFFARFAHFGQYQLGDLAGWCARCFRLHCRRRRVRHGGMPDRWLCSGLPQQPISCVETVAVYRYLLAVHQVVDEERNQFFRMLVGTVVVRATCDDGGEAVGFEISAAEQISSRLA